MSEHRPPCPHERIALLGPASAARDAATGAKFVLLVGQCRACGMLLRRRTVPAPYGPWEPFTATAAGGTTAA